MRTLAFDGRVGASGDMLLGALVAAGADPSVLDTVESSLPVEYAVDSVTERGIAATSVDVLVEGSGEGHDHDHPDDGHTHAEGHGPQRTYAEVVDLVESMDLPAGVERDALAIFEMLGEAEASVHGTGLADTRFHEVGADDAIADVVGTALLRTTSTPSGW